MPDETKKKPEAQKTHEQILAEFNALKTHTEKVKYFQANKEVLRFYYSEGCFQQ